MQSVEENNYAKGWIGTVLVHGILLLICFFLSFHIEFPPEETEAGGIVINYGTDEEGMGTDVFSKEEPSIGPVASPDAEPQKTVTNSNETPQNTQPEQVATQEFEEAPAVKSEPEKKVESSNTPVSTKTEIVKEAPKVKADAMYKGKKNDGLGKGDGTGNKPGNQGSRDGSTSSTSYVGGGSGTGGNGIGSGKGGDGNGGVALNLSGRKFITRPRIQDDGQTSGKVVVEISADRTGTITEAKAGYRGTTISNIALWKKCEKAVLGAKLNSVESAPDLQIGTVTFTFLLQ